MALSITRGGFPMAADKRKTNLSEMCQNNLDKLLHVHMVLYNQIYEERRRLERVCYLNRQLLQPWSCKGTADNPEPLTLPQTGSSTTPNNTDLAVSVESLKIEDSEEVALVNKLLAKAVKARSSIHQESKNEENTASVPIGTKDKKTMSPHLMQTKSAHRSKQSQCIELKSAAKIRKPCSNDLRHGGRVRPASSAGSKASMSVIPPYKTDPERARKTTTRTVQKSKKEEKPGHRVNSAVILSGGSGDGHSERVSSGPPVIQNVNVNNIVNKDVSSKQNQTKGDTCSKIEQESASVQPNFDDRFHLLKDGGKLTIPSQLRKQLSQNSQLKEKLNACRLTMKVDYVTHKQTFIQRLIDLEDVNKKVQLAAKIHTQTLIHQKLLTELINLCSNALKGERSASDVLRKRMLLEMILQTYEECGEEVSSILKEGVMGGFTQSIHSPHVQLPQQQLNQTDKLLTLNSMDTDGGLEYHSEKHLLRYIRDHQSQTMLNIQQIITTGVVENLLPELQRASKQNSHSVVPLYRAIYSLLSHPGHQLPTIVKDTIDLSGE